MKFIERAFLFFLVACLLLSGANNANADFSGDMSPSNWIYMESNTSANGPRNSLDAKIMEIISADWTSGASQGTYGQYGIAIPWYLESIKFEYSYVTYDVDGSSFDMPSYSLDGNKTFLVSTTIPKNGTASGTVNLDVSSLAGKPLFFTQECSDCVLGAASLKITNFIAKTRSTLLNTSTLSTSSVPVLSRDANGFTCKAPTFSFKRYGYSSEVAAPTSFVYSLSFDGKKISTISSDNWKTMSQALYSNSNETLKGIASTSFAFWPVVAQNFTSAQCEVIAYQDNSTSLSFSNVLSN